jgi:hypothetical protein
MNRKTAIIGIIVIGILLLSGFWMYDHGKSKEGKDITVLTSLNTAEPISVEVINTKHDGIYELTDAERVKIKKLLISRKYGAVSEKRFTGSYHGDGFFIFAGTDDNHRITICIYGYEKMSVTDETENKTEYYLIRDDTGLENGIQKLILK